MKIQSMFANFSRTQKQFDKLSLSGSYKPNQGSNPSLLSKQMSSGNMAEITV